MRYLLSVGLTGTLGLIAVFLSFVHEPRSDSSPATTARATGTLRVGLLDPSDADYLLVESDSSSADYGKFIVGAATVGLAWGDGVLAAGTPGPYYWPGSGGARFLPEASERREAKLQYLDNEMRIEGNPLNAMDYPAFHGNIPTQSPVLTVPNCGDPTRGAVPLATQMTRIILSKTSRAYAAVCPSGRAPE